MMNGLCKTLLSSLKTISPLQVAVRNYEKKPFIRRYGYEEKILNRGLLPRIKDKDDVKTPYEEYKPKDPWAEKRALFGQNDYIDILGDGNVHPVRLLTNVPYWLRGFAGNEFKRLIRKRKFLGEYMKSQKPTKFIEMEKRMRHLYRYLNRKTFTSR